MLVNPTSTRQTSAKIEKLLAAWKGQLEDEKDENETVRVIVDFGDAETKGAVVDSAYNME
jgi:hypothetical protein